MKSKKHHKVVKDYEKQKVQHLDKLATRILKDDEKTQRLKEKSINPDFLNLF